MVIVLISFLYFVYFLINAFPDFLLFNEWKQDFALCNLLIVGEIGLF